VTQARSGRSGSRRRRVPAPDRSLVGVDRLRSRLAAIEPLAALHPDRVVVVRAPGRVNLIGEHTDYNDGLVLPAAIDLEIRIALVPTEDGRVMLTLDASGNRATFDLDAIGEKRGTFVDYIAGTAWAMQEAGLPTSGFRGLLASSILLTGLITLVNYVPDNVSEGLFGLSIPLARGGYLVPSVPVFLLKLSPAIVSRRHRHRSRLSRIGVEDSRISLRESKNNLKYLRASSHWRWAYQTPYFHV